MKTKRTSRQLSSLRAGRWTVEEARQVLATQEASGESLAGFARRHGLKAQRLHWWRSRIGDWEPPAAEARLVPAVFGGSARPALMLRVAGVEVEIAEAVEVGWVAELIRLLGAGR